MNKKNWFKLTMIILIFVLVLFFIKSGNLKKFQDVNSLVSYVRSYGKYALVCFIIIFALKPIVVVIPSAMMSIASGILFGPVKGFIVNMLGFFISGTLAFVLSRLLDKNIIDKILRGKAVTLNNNMEKNGFKILLFLRLPPVLPYDPLSYACGLTKIKYKSFITASLLGVVPETICYSYMGQNIFNPFSAKFLVPLSVVIIATVLSVIAFKKSGI